MWYKLYLLTGLILLGVSIYVLKQSIDFIRSSERVTGTVISLEVSDGAYSPVFSITTPGGDEIIYHHAAASNPSSWEVGETATFLNDPHHRSSPRMMRYFWIFNWSLVCLGLAIPLIIIGGGYFVLPTASTPHLSTPRL
ncbi:hypothetical protein SAMN05444266_10378 [Chitinophaga jiangningensis]|uniref:DUF3592 domain-containing protein n=1 Tax=Chitinophaga jiangningensis TaxID=1419482 RepID=A0A1M7A100_9BACT|nr:DUF3592 domain-containing protein [Chitinophaga jiangningensis]SHL36285.1 hypothetical protein SAMN05444266_10378 [Chitinophaga jiangningensis]